MVCVQNCIIVLKTQFPTQSLYGQLVLVFFKLPKLSVEFVAGFFRFVWLC